MQSNSDHLAGGASCEVPEYVPLKGEDAVQYIKRTMRRRECDVCGKPADFRISYLLENARRNPASSAYGHDDCSYCSDAERFVCKDHPSKFPQPEGHSWCSTFTLSKAPHLGLYADDEKIPARGWV